MSYRTMTKNADSSRRRVHAFTLVELMVTLAIIGILAGMVLYTLAGAQRDAKVSRTQWTIKKINDVILTRWEEFRYRAVKVNLPEGASIAAPDSLSVSRPPLEAMEAARTRMSVLRDVMRMEMPDRFIDVVYPPIQYKVALYTSGQNTPHGPDAVQIDREVPGPYLTYRNLMVDSPTFPVPTPAVVPVGPIGSLKSNDPPITMQYQSAELLYQIVMASNYNGSSALEYFRPNEIGDADNDGLPEFLDAWGQPIRWIRWPAGYTSPLNDDSVPDAFDPMRSDFRLSSGAGGATWLLVPLVVSAGPDGIFDLVFDFDTANNNAPCVDPSTFPDVNNISNWRSTQYVTRLWTTAPSYYTAHGPHYFLDPFMAVSIGSVPVMAGAIYDTNYDSSTEGCVDNITNYDLLLQ